MKKYRCIVCDYIYDPVEGDPDGGIDPGTASGRLGLPFVWRWQR